MGRAQFFQSATCWLRTTVSSEGIRHLLRVRSVGRIEFLVIRILFAVVIYQTLPLGPPFSDVLAREFPDAVEFAEENNNSLRPLPPLTQILPQSLPVMKFEGQPLPNGIAHHIDLSFFSSEKFARSLAWVTIPCLLFYAAGVGLPICLPILTLANIGACTLRNSQGSIHHGYQMISLILLAQTIVALFWLFRNRREALLGSASSSHQQSPVHGTGKTLGAHLVYYSALIVAGCYVIAGAIKMINSDGEWPRNAHYIGIQVVKTDRQNWHNHLDSENYGKEHVPWASDMLEHRNISRVFMTMGLLLEFLAFLCLLGRIPALIIGINLLAFHYFNEKIMGLVFYNNEKALWIFLILPGLVGLFNWWKTRRA